MSPDSAGTRRQAAFALIGAAAIACGVFAVLVRVDPPSAARSALSAIVTPRAATTTVADSTASELRAAVAPQPGGVAAELDAGAEALWEVRGKVVDPDGRPVPDVVIEVLQAGSGAPTPPTVGAVDGPPALASSDPDLLLARPDNLGVTRGRIPPIPLLAQVPVDTELAAGFVTDSQGHFALAGNETGVVELLAAPAGWAPTKSVPIAVAPGRTLVDFVLVLRRGAQVEGTTVDSRGDPLPGVRVETFCPGDPLPRSTLSDRDGHFAFAGALGQCELVATPIDLPLTRLALLAIEGETQVIEVRIAAEAHTLECSVEDGRGFPIAGAAVEVRAPTGAGVLAAALSGTDGQVSIPRLPAPPYRVAVSHPDYAPRIDVPVAKLGANRITLMAGTRVSGAVVTVPGQVALPAARIEVWSSAGLLVHSTRTGDFGTFELRNVTAGDYSIIISQSKTVQKRFARAIGAVDPHDRRVDWGTFEVSEGGSISGTVVDRLGVPVPAAHVFTVGGETITDGDGAFVLPGLPAGPLVVRARHPSAGETSHGLSVRAFAGQDTPGARLQLSGRLEPDAAPLTASRAEPGVDVSREAPLAGPTAAPTGPAIELATGRAGVSVVTVVAGSAPAQAGLRSGDTIVSIDGETVSIAGQARSLLRGDTGTLVTLEIRRGGGRQRIKFRRERSGAP